MGTPAVIIVTPPKIGEDGLPETAEVVHNVYIPVRTPVSILLLATVISAVIAGIFSFGTGYYTSTHVHELKLEIDSKMDMLLKLNAAAAYEKGKTAGAATERNYENDNPPEPGPQGKPGPRGKTGQSGSGVHIF